MAIECNKCVAILNLGYQLDRDAKDLQEKVDSRYYDIVSENNKKWEEYASKCNMPIVGSIYQKVWNRPRVLIGIGPFYNDIWFRDDYSKIQKGAKLLENLKKNDTGHWGDEIIFSGISGDPMSGKSMKREESYDFPDRFVFAPEKYTRFYPTGELSMDPRTRKLVPEHDVIDRS